MPPNEGLPRGAKLHAVDKRSGRSTTASTVPQTVLSRLRTLRGHIQRQLTATCSNGPDLRSMQAGTLALSVCDLPRCPFVSSWLAWHLDFYSVMTFVFRSRKEKKQPKVHMCDHLHRLIRGERSTIRRGSRPPHSCMVATPSRVFYPCLLFANFCKFISRHFCVRGNGSSFTLTKQSTNRLDSSTILQLPPPFCVEADVDCERSILRAIRLSRDRRCSP